MRDVKQGLSLSDHQQLGATLRRVRSQLVDVRQVVAGGLGSGTPEYGAVGAVLRQLKQLELALSLEAVGQHVDTVPMGQLQRLYGDDNLQPENSP